MERLGIGRPSTYSPTIKTLKAREYVRLAKGKLQPTELGMKVSDFLEKALPDLVDVRFTANMEQQLDAIASGKLDWQRYLNTWNQECFAPALAKARGLASTATGSTGVRRKAGVKPSGVKCPKCSQEMVKVPSTKCTGGHFLSCDARASGCGAVMFLNSNTQQYELPGSSPRNKPDPSRLTEHSCPVCGSPLERHDYTSKGEAKTMLRCSNLENRRGSCKEVAFWASRGHFWSPVYGELHSNSGKSATSTPVKPRPRRGKK
jgi:DNA topoisomerase-1